jgi:hypothetical protein
VLGAAPGLAWLDELRHLAVGEPASAHPPGGSDTTPRASTLPKRSFKPRVDPVASYPHIHACPQPATTTRTGLRPPLGPPEAIRRTRRAAERP